MAGEWGVLNWGDLASLEYGKGLRGYEDSNGPYRVFGTNGPIGWHDKPLSPAATVVVGRKGAYRGIHYSAQPCFVIDTAFYLQPRTEFDMRWAYYALLTQDINAMDSGSAIPSTSRDEFYRLPVAVPLLPEQRAIAHILGTLDDKIELNRRMTETLETAARAIFKSWFVDFDPVRAKAEGRPLSLPEPLTVLIPDRIETSEMGDIPAGSEVRGLDEIAVFLNGLALQNYPPREGNSLPVVKIAQLRAGDTRGADRASADIDPAYIVDDGDILFSWSGTLECVIWASGTGALNQHLFKATSAKFPRWFYYLWIQEHLTSFRQIAAGKATTMGHIQRYHLREAKVVVPSPDMLEAADKIIGPIIERITRGLTECRTLAALRDALLSKLISGELRVKDAERIVGTAA